MKTIHVLYFAFLREQAGVPSETVNTAASTLLELYEELRTRHSFSLASSSLLAAIDDTYTPLTSPLPDGATVAFLPPVSGG